MRVCIYAMASATPYVMARASVCWLDRWPDFGVFQISGLNKKGPQFKYPGYNVDHPIIPHGVTYVLPHNFSTAHQ